MSNKGVDHSKKKILIVDDSELNRSLLSDMLSDEYEILEAENGLEASGIMHNKIEEISLVLLDIVMPIMDGFETLEVMNKNGWIKTVPVIMITAEMLPEYIDKAFDLGVQDFINRPFDERIVRRRVVNTLMLFSKQKDLLHLAANQILEKEQGNQVMIEILSNIVEFRNGESGLHVLHIRTFTELILRHLLTKTDQYAISKRDIPLICNASALHDIGKISIPEEVLNKPGAFNKEEYELMKTHSMEGAKILQNISFRENDSLVKYAYQICRWHHERYDGKGYPDGLKGDEIPIVAQVVALADVYDALTSKRVYKAAYSHEESIRMILNGECGTFNPLLLECLKEIEGSLQQELSGISTKHEIQREVRLVVEQIMEKNDLDISDRSLRLLEKERMKYQFFAGLSHEIQFEYTEVPEMIELSEWSANYLGLPESILNPREHEFGTEIFKKEDFESLLTKLKKTTPDNPIIEEVYLLCIHGVERWGKVIARSLWRDEEELEYTGAVGKIVDFHEEMEKMHHLEALATHDSLTQLLNHKAAKAQISSILADSEEKKYILLFFDVDHFKQINDQYGHLFGDEILKYIANVLIKGTRSGDILARMGGDEFMVFMPYKVEKEPQVKRIFNLLCSRYKDLDVSVSMGVACVEDCNQDYETLFRMADDAMYEVKREGGKAYRFYKENEQ